VGRALGANEPERMRPISHGAQIMSALFMGSCALVFVFQGEQLAGAFVKELDVIALAAKLLVIAAIFQLTDGAQVVAASSLRGLSDVKVPTVITAFAYWGLALPLAYWLGFGLGWEGMGVWTGLAAGLTFAAIALIWRFIWRTRVVATTSS
jgi:MATE family multidrug resistance protein